MASNLTAQPAPTALGAPVVSDLVVRGRTRTAAWLRIGLIVALSALGIFWGMWVQMRGIWTLWMNDELRSMGILIPFTSIALLFHAWRKSKPVMRGSWWGLAVCGLALAAARFDGSRSLVLHFSTEAFFRPLFVGLLLFAFVSGVVLLFAGAEAWRRGLFPLALLLCVNPVPQAFNHAVDLPLQYVGAHTANCFASWLHIPLDANELRLMFSPALGMFIAPGCNGLRGAVAMGYLAMIIGYLWSFPRWLWVAYTASGVLFAYLLNLVRLCMLVLCYKLALSVPILSRHMEAADYALGSLIFFSASLLFFTVPRQWKRPETQRSS